MRQHKNVIWRNENGQTTCSVVYVLESDIASMTFNVRCPSEAWHEYVPFGIDYHADEEQYEGQTKLPCTHRPQGFCYADGSSLAATKLWSDFIASGLKEDVIWDKLKQWLTSRFPTAI